MKNEDLIGSALYGTWYFVTESTTDLGYYDGQAYMVMHFMPDPMQPIHSCDDNDDDDYDDDINNNSTTNCNEEQNNVCNYDPQTGKKECINTEKSTVEWSDGTCAVCSVQCVTPLFGPVCVCVCVCIIILTSTAFGYL